jgi:NTE family protein
VRSLLRGFFGDRRIEELRTRYFSVSCDLIDRQPVVHKTGPLFDAVQASLSIPGVFPPMSNADGQLLVDGGVLDNLPVGTMASTGEGPVIAVDVTGRMAGEFRKPVRPGIARVGRPIRRYLTGTDAEVPRLIETIVRTVTVGSSDTAEAARRHADLVIQPRVEGVGLLDWRQLDAVVETGRAAARRVLENPPAWLTGSGPGDGREPNRTEDSAPVEDAGATGIPG